MKYLYILLLFCLGFQVFGMELPFGPKRDTIKAAITLLEKGDTQQKKDGFKMLLQLSSQGNAEAKYSLACTYEYGVLSNDQPNYNLAFQNMKQSADAAYGPAFIKMAEYYKRGFGTPINIEKAIEYYQKARDWYNRAIQPNDYIAFQNRKVVDIELARMYLIHYKNDQDRVKQAIQILENQLAKDTEDAALILADYYEKQTDFLTAEKYYKKALEIKPHDEEAEVQLANLYLFRFSNDSEKIQRAVDYLKNAVSKSKNPVAAFRLGFYYYDHEEFQKAEDYLKLVFDPHYLAQKYILEGLLYSHEGNPDRDLSKALEFYEHGLKTEPDDNAALLGVWRIWLESPELVQDQQKIKDILQKLFQSKDSQALFKLGLGYKYGIYGLEKNKTKANQCFQKVLDDASRDSDVLKALLYSEGIYVKKDLSQALKVLERSRLKSKWTEQLYLKFQDDQRQELIEEEELTKRKLPKEKAPSSATAPKLPAAKAEQVEVPEAEEAQAFEQEPETQAQQEEFKQGLIQEINNTYKPNDGSFVKDINFIMNEIFIEDPQHDKEIILSYKDDETRKKRKKRMVKQLRYDPRVQEWFTKSPQELQQKYNLSTIDNHTFAKIVDYYIQLYGIPIPRTDTRRELILPGTIINTKTGKKQKTIFEYTFYQDEPGSPRVLFHRLARPVFR